VGKIDKKTEERRTCWRRLGRFWIFETVAKSRNPISLESGFQMSGRGRWAGETFGNRRDLEEEKNLICQLHVRVGKDGETNGSLLEGLTFPVFLFYRKEMIRSASEPKKFGNKGMETSRD